MLLACQKVMEYMCDFFTQVRKEIRMQHFDTKKETMGKVIRITEESVRFLLAASHPLLVGISDRKCEAPKQVMKERGKSSFTNSCSHAVWEFLNGQFWYANSSH